MKKEKYETVELEEGEVALIIEALKVMEKKVRDDRIYRRDHPEGFYDIYLERYNRLLNKLSLSTRIIKVPESMKFKI